MTSCKKLNRHSPQNSPYFCVRVERQRDQAKVLERRWRWRVRLRRETSCLEKPNVSFSQLKSRKDTEKKNTILTIQKQKLTNNGFCVTKNPRWPAPVFTTNLFAIHSRQRADGMACDLVLSAQGAVSALCIDQVNGCIVAGVQEIIRWEETPYLPDV